MPHFLEAPRPANEAERLVRLRSYAVLDTPAEEAYDDFTALASQLLKAPIALISLVDEERQWFKSRVGLDVEETPRRFSFCAHATLQKDIFVVEDAHADVRFAGNPLVLGDPHIRFYAGCPLVSPDGLAIGTLCVIDHQPRQLTEEDAVTLRRLGRQLCSLLELRRTTAEHAESQRLLMQRTAELKRLALVAERTHNVVILADPGGRITWVNAAFERVTGYTSQEAIGRKPGQLLQFQNSSPEARKELGLAVKERRRAKVQILNRGKQGNIYWMDVDLQPLYDDDGEFAGFVAIETQITELVKHREHLDALIEAVPVGLIIHDGQLQVRRFNSAAHHILGGQAMEPGGNLQPYLNKLLQQVAQQGVGSEKQLVNLKNASGESRWLGVRVATLPNTPGSPHDMIVALTDQTDQILAGNYMELAAQTADLGHWTWYVQDDMVELPQSWARLLQLESRRIASSQFVHPDDQPLCRRTVSDVLRGLQTTFKFEARLRTGDGRWRWVLCGGAVTERSSEGLATRFAGIFLDIDPQKKLEQALLVAATTDPLTGLPNRVVMHDRLRQALHAAQRHGYYCALLYLDLDHFKRINDSYGHTAGDELLKRAAALLLDQLREEDTLSRMGGDEMMVLLPQLGTDMKAAQRQAHRVASKLMAALESPLEFDGKSVVVGASVGVTLFPKQPDETAEDLIREADTAMYSAKDENRGTVRFYEPSMRLAATHRLQLDHDLRQAMEERSFELYMQGKWSPDRRLLGGELLLRWKHPVRGWVSPAEFIPVAEESELIQHIGRYVLEEAMHIAQTVRQRAPDFVVAVNISPKQFRREEFVRDLHALVVGSGLPPEALMLEITEGVLLQEQLARRVVLLSEEGYRFSLDDFGTGYSSLAYLKRLPVHELKIDRAFVRDIETDPEDAALVQAILAIAERFGIHTVAEGIETSAQLDFLAHHGCGAVQGFLLDKPRPWRQFVQEFLGP